MSDPLQSTFRALADPTRRDILKLLGSSDLTIAQVSTHFDMTRAAVKKHLTVLSDGGLITVEAKGRERINRLNAQGMKPVLSWFEYFDQFWDENLASLKNIIEQDTK